MKERQIKTVLEVLEVMQKGYDRIEAFRIVAERHRVIYSTISSQCVRELGLKSVYEFDKFAKAMLDVKDNPNLIETIVEYRSGMESLS